MRNDQMKTFLMESNALSKLFQFRIKPNLVNLRPKNKCRGNWGMLLWYILSGYRLVNPILNTRLPFPAIYSNIMESNSSSLSSSSCMYTVLVA